MWPNIRNYRRGVLWTWSATLALIVAMAGGAEAALRIGTLLPSITLPGVAGAPARIPDNLRGKVVLLHFWAVGCSSCRKEMSALDGLYGAYRRKGLEILAVNVGQRREIVKTSAAELKVSYPILLDADRKAAVLFDVAGLPCTYILDRNGVIRYKIIGDAAGENLKKLILSIL